jgi:hypothetical protein
MHVHEQFQFSRKSIIHQKNAMWISNMDKDEESLKILFVKLAGVSRLRQ